MARIKPVLEKMQPGPCGCNRCKAGDTGGAVVPPQPLSWGDSIDVASAAPSEPPVAATSSVPSAGGEVPSFFEDAMREMEALSSSFMKVNQNGWACIRTQVRHHTSKTTQHVKALSLKGIALLRQCKASLALL